MCPHCNSPTRQNAPSAPYCCAGCQAAHALVRAAGLERFYELRGAERLAAVGGRQKGEVRAPRHWLLPLGAQAELGRGEVVRLVLDLQGLQCIACVWLLERLFARQPGAVRLTINTGVGRMELCYRRGSSAVESFLDDAEALGYRAGPPRKQSDAPLDDLVLRLGLCAALAMNAMIFSFSQYFGLAVESDGLLFRLFAVGSLILASLCVLLGGTIFFRSAIAALRRGVLHMDVPIALGIALSYLGSVWSFFFASGRAAYFDTLCIFITLMLLGRLLQQRLASHHRRILLSDDGVDGLLVRALDQDSQLQLVPAAAIKPGQVLLCAPGELVPVRAELLEPRADFSLSWISGESEPAVFQKGQCVPAGAHNQSRQAVRVCAREAFSASALYQLLAASPAQESGKAEPARHRDFWHILSRTYVLGVLALAALGFLLWLPHDPVRALEVTVAILVVTCPCALGVATPLAYELVQVRLRRRGLFVRHASFLDRALRVRKVLFDKTGTLTLGELTLAAPEQLNQLPAAARAALYQMVARSNHPASQALLRALTTSFGAGRPALDPALAVTEEPGQGLTLCHGDHEYRLGRRGFVLGSAESEPAAEVSVLFGRDGERLAQYCFVEDLCPDARTEVEQLQRAGLEVWMLSGDTSQKVADSARRLGLDNEHAYGSLSPKDKARRVRLLDGGEGDTLMIGDGINDALAFAAAACTGTPAVDRPTLPARADFYFLGVGLGPIALALALARKTHAVIRRNLGLAALYNAVVLGLSFGGLMTPLRCAIAMPLSSLLILLATVHSLREPPAQREAPEPMPFPALHPAEAQP